MIDSRNARAPPFRIMSIVQLTWLTNRPCELKNFVPAVVQALGAGTGATQTLEQTPALPVVAADADLPQRIPAVRAAEDTDGGQQDSVTTCPRPLKPS